MDHLMINCEKVYQLCCFVFRSFRVSWVLPRTVIELLFGWRNWLGKYSFDIWNLASSCLL